MLVADQDELVGVRFGGPAPTDVPRVNDDPFLAEVDRQLAEYRTGERTTFDLPMTITDGSDFERRVWAVLRQIPFGQTWTYGQVATEIGDPGAARAVGTACNHNPLPVVIACHRVVGANRTLVGFGGGLPRKRWLLEHEARIDIEREFSTIWAAE